MIQYFPHGRRIGMDTPDLRHDSDAFLRGQCRELATRYLREGPRATKDLVEALEYLIQIHGSRALVYYTAAGGPAPSDNKIIF